MAARLPSPAKDPHSRSRAGRNRRKVFRVHSERNQMRPVIHSATASLFGALALALSTAPPVSAQNLVVNPNFDNALGISAWLETGTWSPDDWEGSPGSGSLQITNSFSSSAVLLARQCVQIVAGNTYQVEGRVRAAPGQFEGSTDAALTIGWWTSSNCASGNTLGTVLVGIASETGAWERIGPTTVVAPAGAAGANVRLQVLKGDGSGSFTANFDAVSLPEPSEAPAALVAIAVITSLRRWQAKSIGSVPAP